MWSAGEAPIRCYWNLVSELVLKVTLRRLQRPLTCVLGAILAVCIVDRHDGVKLADGALWADPLQRG